MVFISLIPNVVTKMPYETPREEIARLRKMELEPQHYDVDINKEVSSSVLQGQRGVGLGGGEVGGL